MGRKALNSNAAKQLKDSGQHVVAGVVHRVQSVEGSARETQSAAAVVARDAANGKVDPKHVVTAGEKAAGTVAKAAPHRIVAGAVTDEVLRKAPLSDQQKQAIQHVTDPKKALLEQVHSKVNAAVTNLPPMEITGVHAKPAAKASASSTGASTADGAQKH
jgi:hypothetical protein